MKDLLQCSTDMKQCLTKCSAIASSMSARTTVVKQILKKMQEEMNDKEKLNSNMDSKSNDNRNQIKNQPQKILKNDENQPKDSQQVKKEEEVGIKQKLNDKHIILTPLDGDWQLDGEILDMTIANNILDTMNIKPNDLTDDLIDDCKISSYVPESEWKPTYNPFHPQNWFRTKPQVGKVVIPDINPKLRLFHPFANGIQCWNALYNLFILISFPMIPFTVGDPDFVSLLYILSPLATLFNIINAFVCLNTAKLVDGRFITNRWTLFKNRLLNGGIFLDILTGFPWIFLCEYLGDELLTIYYPDLHGKAVTSGAGNTSGAINYHLPPVYEFESNHMLLKYTICFLHLLLCIRLFDSREIHEWMSIKKLQEKHQISGSLMLAFKVSIYQIWYWNFSVSIQSLIYGKPKELQYSFGVYTYYMEIIATKKLPTPKVADFKVLTVTMNSLLVTFFVILLVTIIASWADELNRPVKTFKARVEEVNQFSNYRGFGMPFRQKLMQYYSFKYYGGVYFDEEHILSQLNTSLHAYINIRTCRSLIAKVPFFKDAEANFVEQVAMILKLEHYINGDYVIEKGTKGDKMYFIAQGTLEVVIDGVAKAKLETGAFFGEIALLMGPMKRTASIRATNPCKIYSLSKKDLSVILKENKTMEKKLTRIAEERLAADKPKETPPISPKDTPSSSAQSLPSASQQCLPSASQQCLPGNDQNKPPITEKKPGLNIPLLSVSLRNGRRQSYIQYGEPEKTDRISTDALPGTETIYQGFRTSLKPPSSKNLLALAQRDGPPVSGLLHVKSKRVFESTQSFIQYKGNPDEELDESDPPP